MPREKKRPRRPEEFEIDLESESENEPEPTPIVLVNQETSKPTNEIIIIDDDIIEPSGPAPITEQTFYDAATPLLSCNGIEDIDNPEELYSLEGPEFVRLRKILRPTLRRYQRRGLYWLRGRESKAMKRICLNGGIFADEMGLGKTVVCLALASSLPEKNAAS